jgi:tetratricopeptide (TPR) repeat protein
LEARDRTGVSWPHERRDPDWSGAAQQDLKALSILEPLSNARPADVPISLTLAAVYREACYDLNKTADRARALDLCQKAVGINEHVATSNPNDVRARLDLAMGYGDLGTVLSDEGDLDRSLQCWRKALALSEAVADADHSDARAQVSLALADNRLGWLLAKTGRTADTDYGLRGLAIRKRLYDADPLNGGRKEAVAISFATLGDTEVILAQSPGIPPGKRIGHWRGARAWYAQAMEAFGDLRAHGTLRGEDSGEPDRIARELTRCDAALGNTRSPPPSPASR